MTAKDLRAMLEGVPDDTPVYIPLHEEFDGMWVHPCMEDSGLVKLGTEESDEEDEKERQLLNKPESDESAFVFVRCGFIHAHDEDRQKQLN